MPPRSDLKTPRSLSVVIPVFNEQENIPLLCGDLFPVLESTGLRWECVIVNDGSSDRTEDTLRLVASSESRLKVINLAENRGQGAALFHGLKRASGEIIVTMDGDRQNVPEDITIMLEKLNSSEADMVVGIRQKRRDSRMRLWMSRIANTVRSKVLADGVQDSGCALKVFKREVVDALIPMQTLYSFVPALAAGGGYRVTELPVQHRERNAGVSSYGLIKMLWRPLVDMLGVLWFNRRRADAPTKKSTGLWGWAVSLCFVVITYFAFVGDHGLLEPDEGRYAEIPREMVTSGDYLVPTLNGIPHFQKPPLLYWATALSYKVFGNTEWSARLPSVLGGLGTLGLTFWIAYCFGGIRLAGVATLVLASSLEFFLLSRTLTPDMMMTLWITASIAALITYRRGQASTFRWLFFIFMGLGFLTKGPMALVVPLCAALGFWIGDRKRTAPTIKAPWIIGMCGTLAISLSWFIAVSLRHGELFDYFLRYELLDRFTSSTHGRSQPMWFFVPILAAGFMPWTLFVPVLAYWLIRSQKEKAITRDIALLLGWIILPFFILSISGSKLLTYILPLFPALAVLMGMTLLEVSKWQKRPVWIMSGLVAGLAVTTLAWPLIGPTDYQVPLPLVVPMALFLSAMVLLKAASCESRTGFVQGVGATALAIWLLVASQVGAVNPYLKRQASVKRLAGIVRSELGWENARIVAANVRAHGFEFYLGRTLGMTEREGDAVLPTTERQRANLLQTEEVAALQAADLPIYVLTRDKNYWKNFHHLSTWERLAQEGAFVLLRQNPASLADASVNDSQRSAVARLSH